ncbi:Uncharacterized protein BP5553_00630 [Venustampulla echinocandica]|uniref:DUF7729 domain-containing protein n=1 Tax=Venustampulla echinocandica TaxID=2656787 RepID=A0A370TYR5_9HELO|nr:Uncharacterized protein BP5553_00630 [Venustampulla echinocandica]RDL40651.1 Uncharacterized protein BP5553_00630 [Venustampulla echinocandica]
MVEEVPGSEGSTMDGSSDSGRILADPSPPPKSQDWGDWTLESIQELRRRDAPFDVISSSSSSNSVTEKTQTVTRTVASTTSSSSSGIVTAAPTDASAPLPIPFDSGFNSNLTANCASFMNTMLANATFRQCLPISLLLQNSQSFFQAETSIVRITRTLDATCAADVSLCGKIMDSLGRNITTDDACASDIANLNPLILQARLGLLAYKPLYTASCLKNPVAKSYCFADAITNSSNPSDNYLYYLPLNVSLPSGSQPTCNTCLHNTMAVFEAATSDRSSAIANNFVDAAMQINVKCGPNFVNASLAAPITSDAQSLALMSGGMPLIMLGLAVASWLF